MLGQVRPTETNSFVKLVLNIDFMCKFVFMPLYMPTEGTVPFCLNQDNQRRTKTVNRPLNLTHGQNIVGLND